MSEPMQVDTAMRQSEGEGGPIQRGMLPVEVSNEHSTVNPDASA